MIFAVSTVRDTRANLESFVARNLAGGADHLVVFVDDDDAELLDVLAAHPHTTGVAARSWWGEARPGALNSRQRIGANVVRSLAAHLGDVDWVFHVDGDEVIQVDTGRLADLGAEVRAVRLEVREAVAQWEPAATGLFKRRLTKPELRTLVQRGAIDKARNDHYFHGHVNGKVGIRPTHDLWLGIHRAMDAQREAVDAFEAPWLRLLHYESRSGADFARKWRNLLDSGTEAAIRSARAPIADAVRAELAEGREPSATSLRAVFEETTADDVATLLELGYVEEVDPLRHGHVPSPYPQVDVLSRALDGLRTEDKRAFEPGRDRNELSRVLDQAFG